MQTPSTLEIKEATPGYTVTSEFFTPWWNKDTDINWNKSIESGKSYLCGNEMPTEKFITSHTKPLTEWQAKAFQYCKSNPSRQLKIESKTHKYKIHWTVNFCTISLPHQTFGGEKTWISQDGKNKVLVNLD